MAHKKASRVSNSPTSAQRLALGEEEVLCDFRDLRWVVPGAEDEVKPGALVSRTFSYLSVSGVV